MIHLNLMKDLGTEMWAAMLLTLKSDEAPRDKWQELFLLLHLRRQLSEGCQSVSCGISEPLKEVLNGTPGTTAG